MKPHVLSALNHKIPPPILTLLMGSLMWLMAHTSPRLMMADSMRLAVTALFLLPGLALLVGGFMAFRQANTTINPVNIAAASSLVTGGVFRISRNPMYLGFAALLLAWGSYLAAPWTFTLVGLFVLYIQLFQIFPEERVMQEKFGTAFAQYRQDVRRWL